jgi:hypothetical protein
MAALIRQDMTLADEIDMLGETDLRRGAPIPPGVLVQDPQKRASPATEAQIQRAIIRRLAARGIVALHVRNEGKRSDVERLRAVADGLMPGFPDLILIGTHGRVGFLEVKSGTGRLSPQQRDRIAMLHRRGQLVAVVRDQDYAEHVIRQWGWII